jgi:hypothetical protein
MLDDPATDQSVACLQKLCPRLIVQMALTFNIGVLQAVRPAADLTRNRFARRKVKFSGPKFTSNQIQHKDRGRKELVLNSVEPSLL